MQKLFFLLFMGVFLSFVCACGDDEDSIQELDTEQTTLDTDEDAQPNDSIPSTEESLFPNDSVSGDDTLILPNDSLMNETHEAVDFGLPSGLKWTTCNVGASSSEGFGDYYSWGETEEKSDYHWENYKYFNDYRVI